MSLRAPSGSGPGAVRGRSSGSAAVHRGGGAGLAVATLDLEKRFGAVRALDRLELFVHRGEVHGLLGPNGAGKSTALRVLLGLLRPSGGEVRVLGLDPWRQPAVRRRVAYVPGEVALWPQLRGGEVLDLLGRLTGERASARRRELVDRFALDPTRRCGTYSRGNRQKVALIAAFASEAELLVLDEPTVGLDPLMEAVFADCVRDERSRGRTVLLSSHLLTEVDALCDRVSIVRAGRNVRTDRVADLRRSAQAVVDATVTGEPHLLAGWPGVRDLVVEGKRVRCRVAPDGLAPLLGRLSELGVVSLRCEPPTLEDLFLPYFTPARPPVPRGPGLGPGAGGDG